MTINDYEKQDGFREELMLVRQLGQTTTTIQEKVQSRPMRAPELGAITKIKNAIDELRAEICATRDLAR